MLLNTDNMPWSIDSFQIPFLGSHPLLAGPKISLISLPRCAASDHYHSVTKHEHWILFTDRVLLTVWGTGKHLRNTVSSWSQTTMASFISFVSTNWLTSAFIYCYSCLSSRLTHSLWSHMILYAWQQHPLLTPSVCCPQMVWECCIHWHNIEWTDMW